MGEDKEEIEKVSKKVKGKKQRNTNKKSGSNVKDKKLNNIISEDIINRNNEIDKEKAKKEKGKNKDKKTKLKSKSELTSKTKNEDKRTEENTINKEDVIENIIESDNIDELENTKSNKEKRVVLDSVGKVKVDEIETEEQLEKLQEKTNEKLKENNKEDVKIITKKELEKKELEEDIQKKVIEKLGNNRKKRISIIIFLILISFIAIISTCFSVIYMGRDVIVPNVYIGDINVGNMSKEKAKETLETIYTEKASKEIKASLKDYEHIIKPEMVEFKVDINSAVDKAYMIGRERKYNRK